MNRFTLVLLNDQAAWWQVTTDDGHFVTLCDQDGDAVSAQGTFVPLSHEYEEIPEELKVPTNWRVYHAKTAGNPDLHEQEGGLAKPWYYEPSDGPIGEIGPEGHETYLEALYACQEEAALSDTP